MGTQATYPVIGLPSDTKQAGQRVDFRPKQFDLAIETKGYLLAWQQGALCPCTAGIEQSKQPDPNCSLCGGQGMVYFESPISQDLTGYEFTDLQQNFLTETGAMVIRGIITAITNKQDMLDKAGNWVDGRCNLTVRPENKLGYLDRITGLDILIAYAELLVGNGVATLAARYPVVNINFLRSIDTVYVADTDYNITVDGKINWLTTPPESGERLSIHYLCHPTWLIIDHPHTARVTSKLFKTPTPKTPLGDPRDLPTQAMILYEFLV